MTKYGSNTKWDRNYRAKEMRLEGYTYSHIGKTLGISRQRVEQLLSPPLEVRQYMLDKTEGKCESCGIHIGRAGHIHHKTNGDDNYNDLSNLEFLCISCHRNKHKDDKVWNKYPKYASNTKTDRNLAIVKLRLSDTNLSLKDIGRLFGISKARVCAIIKRYNSTRSDQRVN